MLPPLFAAVLFAVPPQQPSYSTPALRDLVERAAQHNRAAPPDLDAYRAQVESEIAVATQGADGEESPVSIEQASNEVRWLRSGDFAQHVTGYRARLSGPSISALAVFNRAWTIPMLYGNRLSRFFGQDSVTGKIREDGDVVDPGRSTLAVHPFAARRDGVYDFSGGDTVAVIQSGQRSVTVVRVLIEPKPEQAEWPVIVFRGEINLDAELGEVVRMRGQFVTMGRRGPQRQRALVVPVSVRAYVDLESVLIRGRYWLPHHQRIEQHVDVAGLAQGRAVFRIVSRFADHQVLNSSAGDVSLRLDSSGDAADGHSLDQDSGQREHRLTIASRDSLGRPRDWKRPLGDATTGLRGDDFVDVGTPRGTPGSPAVAWRAQRLADLIHFNRVEGWTTGAAIEAGAPPWAPGLQLRANAGWAWTAQTVRGRVEALQTGGSGSWTAGARVGRTLDITNDFTAPWDSGGSLLEALAGVDRYDYVDRRATTLWVNLDPASAATVTVEVGVGRDESAVARLTRGLWASDVPFAPNRGVDEGRYTRVAVHAGWNQAVSASALVTGFGARVGYEAGSGELDWQRITLRLVARQEIGALAFASRVHGGALFSDRPPPQQLFEVGGEPALPGFGHKEFAGDRALTTEWRVAYRLPVLRSPMRLMGCTCFTAPAPALAVTLHGARVSASSPATMASIARLGSMGDQVGQVPAAPGTWIPVARPTGGWLGSLEVGLRFFGGAATLGAVRVNEPGAPWRPRLTLGQTW
jgi:hypothetical protein